MTENGYGEDSAEQVRTLISKKGLKRDPDAQTLEDVVCLVFLEHYFAAFAAKHSEDKVVDIVRKTWRKMSADGQQAALALDLPVDAGRLVSTALAAAE